MPSLARRPAAPGRIWQAAARCTGRPVQAISSARPGRPLHSALLTPDGINMPIAGTDEVAPAGRCRRAGPQTRPGLARPRLLTPANALARPCEGRVAVHEAFRYDARPPWTDPDTWWYLCDECGRSRITGAELDTSAVIHTVAILKQLTATGRPLISYTQRGSVTAGTNGGETADRRSQPVA